MSPPWRGAPAVLRLLGGSTLLPLLLLLLLLRPHAARGDCPIPPDIPNAQPTLDGLKSFPERSTVTYKCNAGFVKVPGRPDSVVCLESNKWTEIAEFCNRSCAVPTRLLFASLKSPYNKQNYFPMGSVVEYECRNGYSKDDSLSGKLTCLQNYTWSKPEEFCKKKSCPNPGKLINGHVNKITDILFGASITFSCNTGYKLVGEASSYCVIVGNNMEWSNPLPECKESSPTSQVPPTPQKSTTVKISATKAPSTPHRRTTAAVPGTKAPSTQKLTTVNIPATESSSTPHRHTTAAVPGTKALSTQKLTTVNIPATESPSTPHRHTTAAVPGTKAPSTQKLTTVNIPATESPSTPHRHTTAAVPGTKAPSTQKLTTVNIPATEGPSTPQSTINSSATKALLIPQKPTLNVTVMGVPSTPQKPIITNDSATITQTLSVSNALSTGTSPVAQPPVMANSSATQAIQNPQIVTTAKASLTQNLSVTPKSTYVHAPVSTGWQTTQSLTSAHILASQSQAVSKTTMPFHAKDAGGGALSAGLVAGTVITVTLILVKISWDYRKSGSYYTHENNKALDAGHNITDC